MRVLYLSLHAPFESGKVASGNQVRVAGLSTALRSAGYDVQLLSFQESGGEATAGWFRSAAELAQQVTQFAPDVILVGYWTLLAELPSTLSIPVILDAIAPRLLEAQFQEPGMLQQEARDLLQLLPRADYLLVGNQRQADHWLSLLLLAGFDCRDRMPVGIVPIAVSGEPAASAAKHVADDASITLVSAGVDWPWRKSGAYFEQLQQYCEANPRFRFQHIAGGYPGAGGETHLLSHAAMQDLFRQSHIGLELSERNTERELSHSFRLAEYLQCGLPVIVNSWLSVAPLIERYNAGWLIDSPEQLPAVLQAIDNDFELLRQKAEGAQALARAELNYRHCINPLLDYLRQPWRSARTPSLLQLQAAPAATHADAPQQPRFWRAQNFIVQLYQLLFCRKRPPVCDAIVVVTRDDLFPPDHGAAVKILRTAEALSRLGHMVLLCTDNRLHHYVFENGKMTPQVYPLWLRYLALPRRLALLLLLLRGYPWSNAFLYFPLKDFSYTLRSLYLATHHHAGAFMAEFPAYVQPLRFVRKLLGGNIVLVEHNVEYERLREQIPTLPNASYRELKRLELLMCASANSVIAVSEPDRQRLLLDGVDPRKLRMIPHGVDLSAFGNTPLIDVRQHYGIAQHSLLLVYHGTYGYQPNLQAMQFMASDILPRLLEDGFEVDVLAIGSSPPEFALHPRIHFVGSVPELAAVIPACDLAVVSLLQGGGTRMKILDYFAAGVPVISTSKGIEGIPVSDGSEALIRDGADALCAAIADLANDRDKAKLMAGRAREFVQQLSWDSIARRYQPLLMPDRNQQ